MKRLFIHTWDIRELVNEAANKIALIQKEMTASYGDAPVVFVCLLRGGIYYFADLTRALSKRGMTDIELEFLRPSSYTSNGVSVQVTMDNWDDIKKFAGKYVWLIDEIIDSGATVTELTREMKNLPEELRPKKVCTSALLVRYSFTGSEKINKLMEVGCDALVTPMRVDTDDWLFGYGMEDDGKCRNVKDIWRMGPDNIIPPEVVKGKC